MPPVRFASGFFKKNYQDYLDNTMGSVYCIDIRNDYYYQREEGTYGAEV